MDQEVNEMHSIYRNHITKGEDLLQKLEEKNFKCVKGVYKLQRKIKKHILFLSETLERNCVKKEHLVCTNLHFYEGVVEEALNQPDCEAVLETFSYKAHDCQKRLTVDIVSHSGGQWTKIIARNPVALQHIYKEGDSFGRRSVMDQALSYTQAAAQNLHLYCSPRIVFLFVNGVPKEMKNFLEKFGIIVKGKIVTAEEGSSFEDSDSKGDEINYNVCDIAPVVTSPQMCFKRLNLCVTSMIAFVSSLTNGGCNYKFMEPILTQQAEWEKVRPIKPFLMTLFKGKELMSCSTAIEDFKNIINLVGGEEEKKRAADLLSNIEVVPDVPFSNLNPSGKIKERSLVIFGTGHEYNAVTVSANKGFVHAAKQKGVKLAVIIHESRALTERKQLSNA